MGCQGYTGTDDIRVFNSGSGIRNRLQQTRAHGIHQFFLSPHLDAVTNGIRFGCGRCVVKRRIINVAVSAKLAVQGVVLGSAAGLKGGNGIGDIIS